MAALICSRRAADDFDAWAAFDEGVTSSSGAGFLTCLLGVGLGVLGAGGANRLATAGRACCNLPEMVFVPLRGPLGVFLVVADMDISFSADFNILDLVGERARVVVLILRLPGVAAVDLASVVFNGLDGRVFDVNKGTGGIPPSCEVGREL